MKIFSLIFDYDLEKMKNSGRPWANHAYKDKDFVFKYSAASIATFLEKNPHLVYEVLTDDVDLLSKNIDLYKVSTSNLKIIDAKNLIDTWSSHWYCFWPLLQSFDHFSRFGERVLKLDNDLTCLKPIDDLLKHEGAIVWKKERLCSSGRDYWGEKFASQRALGTDNFIIYNTGTWGISEKYLHSVPEILQICEKMISVDISPVSRFPESPGVVARVYSTSDQVSNCFFLHKNNIPIKESYEWFDHHCYSHDAKKNTIERANHLLKRQT